MAHYNLTLQKSEVKLDCKMSINSGNCLNGAAAQFFSVVK